MLVTHPTNQYIKAHNYQTQKRSDIKLYLEQGRPEAAAVADKFVDTFPNRWRSKLSRSSE